MASTIKRRSRRQTLSTLTQPDHSLDSAPERKAEVNTTTVAEKHEPPRYNTGTEERLSAIERILSQLQERQDKLEGMVKNTDVASLSKKCDDLRTTLDQAAAGIHVIDNAPAPDLIGVSPAKPLIDLEEDDNFEQNRPSSIAAQQISPPELSQPALPQAANSHPSAQPMEIAMQQQERDLDSFREPLPSPEVQIPTLGDVNADQDLLSTALSQEARILRLANVQPQQLAEYGIQRTGKRVRFHSPEHGARDTSTRPVAVSDSPDPLSLGLLPRQASAFSATPSTKKSNRTQRSRRASRSTGISSKEALQMFKSGKLMDDDNDDSDAAAPAIEALSAARNTPALPKQTEQTEQTEQPSDVITENHFADDSDTIAVAPRKSERKVKAKDFGDVVVHGYPKKKKARK